MADEQIRELFIEELEQVTGGTGVKETLQSIVDKLPPMDSTMACGEEGPSC